MKIIARHVFLPRLGIGDVIPDDRMENFFGKHFYLSLIGTGSSTTKDDERGTVAGK